MSGQKFRILFSSNLILKKDDQVLLALRENTGWMDGRYHFVGGHIEGGETAEEALSRESQEEIGIIPDSDYTELAFTMHRLNDKPENEYLALYFECTKWTGDPINNEPEKCSELKWFNINNLPENIVPHTRYVLENYSKGVRYLSTKGVEV